MQKTSLVLFLMVGTAGSVMGAAVDEPKTEASGENVAAVLRRHRQIPLGESEALVAAASARAVGDRAAEIELLIRASEGGSLAEVARVELAEALVGSDAGRALELVLPTLERPGTEQLRSAAAEIAVRAIDHGVTAQQLDAVTHVAGRLPRSTRRRIWSAAAEAATPEGRRRLVALIGENPGDGPALVAARRLESLTDLSDREAWQVARSLYRHALYEEAIAWLDRLLKGPLKDVPGWQVALTRGRCSFRRDDWDAAAFWYQRALALTAHATNRAEVEVHLGRTFELAGRLDEAVEAARRAVVADTTDSRRLFLARLRLRTGRPDLAEAGIARIRRSANRSRGRLLIALHALASGDSTRAHAMLAKVTRRPWRGPARVIEATTLAHGGRADEAIDRLEEVAGELGSFWVMQAQLVMGALPEAALERWRVETSVKVSKGGREGASAIVRLAVLEPDAAQYPAIGRMVAQLRPVAGPEPKPRGIAGQLWNLGLKRSAVRWNPGGFPDGSAHEIVWSATAFLDAGDCARAIRTADAAWRSLGADIPPQFYSPDLVAALFPLPTPEALLAAVADVKADASIVAGVAREESRWDPSVLSRVGARGLMQLMPATAVEVAERLNRQPPPPEDLFDPTLSLELGAAELGRLNSEFSGFGAAAVAAYNAGEAQSRLWLEECGPGCDAARFVLTVTFDATRGYTADVLAAAKVYRSVLTQRNEGPGIAPDSGQPSGRSQR